MPLKQRKMQERQKVQTIAQEVERAIRESVRVLAPRLPAGRWGLARADACAPFAYRAVAQQESESEKESAPRLGPQSGKSLLEQAQELKREAALHQETPEERARREEQKLLSALENRKKLMTDQELAKGIVYTEALKTSWRPPRHIREMSEKERDAVREKWHIVVEGDNIPPPIKSFQEMRFPPAVISALRAKGITRPTPIQIQGLPVALSGRDMIGIAFTGSGKTMVFTLPMVMRALEAELKLPLIEKEGPISLVVVPSRELASQIYEGCVHLADHLKRDGFPEIRVLLCIGGINMAEQAPVLRRGVHIVVATCGRLKDMLEKKKLNLDICQYVAHGGVTAAPETGAEGADARGAAGVAHGTGCWCWTKPIAWWTWARRRTCARSSRTSRCVARRPRASV